MTVELCDLCQKRVGILDKTEVVIKDHKGLHIDEWGHAWPDKRKFKAVICDDCLKLLKGNKKEN
jgi:hypothetical protein